MWPVVAAVVIGRILYLIIRDNSQQEGEPKQFALEKKESPPPSIAELRSQLKRAVREKKKRVSNSVTTAASSSNTVPPVSPPKAPQTGSTTSGDGGNKEKRK